MLADTRMSEGLIVIQQDNAAIFKTAEIMTFFQENAIETLEWCPNSPDLSPIEDIWNILKMKMKASPRTYATMRDKFTRNLKTIFVSIY